MKNLFLILLLTMTSTMMAQKKNASTIKKTFSRETSVQIDIRSDVSIIWSLLTNATDYPRWNSTIVSLDGEIKVGEKIKLKSTLDEKRIFKLKVKEVVPEKRMTWGDGKGKRTFILTQRDNGLVTFQMKERVGGLMFPLYAGFIPSFDDSFDQFARDLKKEAEIIFNAK